MGDIYLAHQTRLDRYVALKTIKPEIISPRQIDRFLNEAAKTAQIDHANVITVHDVGEHKGVPYVMMQFIDGCNLNELIAMQSEPLPWLTALKIGRLSAKGLAAIHRKGLIHRDVKPSNIMITSDSQVLVMDLGLVREQSESNLTLSGEIVGTPAYMSPEQARDEPVDERTDVYAIGATVYYLLTAQRPFDGGAVEVLAQKIGGKQPAPLKLVAPDVPDEVANLIARSMHVDRNQRIDSAQNLAREISQTCRRLQSASTAQVEMTDTIQVGLDVPRFSAKWQARPEPESNHSDTRVPSSSRTLAPLRRQQPIWETLNRWLPWFLGVTVAAGLIAAVSLVAYTVKESPDEATPADVADAPGDQEAQPQQTATTASSEKDGMVYIPAGFARLGNDIEEIKTFLEPFNLNRLEHERILLNIKQEQLRRVEVGAFWIDATEVTNAQYAEFLQATNRQPPAPSKRPTKTWVRAQPPAGEEEHPVVNITYDDAEAYAAWKGKKLPTRAQWVRAFRGDEDWLFPWGDTYDATRGNVLDNTLIKQRNTVPVYSTPKDVTEFEVYNMFGNVSEFVRGSFSYDGRPCRMSKGGEFKMFGMTFGIGSSQYFYAFPVVDPGLGFRCVIEER